MQRKAELVVALADIRAKMDELGITVADLGGRHGFVLRRAESTSFVPLLVRLGFFTVSAFGDV